MGLQTMGERYTRPDWVRRLNAMGPQTPSEVQCALDHGARILMLPMARQAREVEQFLKCVDRRAKTIVQIETQSLVTEVERLKALPWDAAYIGLNDLMVSRAGSFIWDAVLDGTVERLFQALEGRAVGFGGVTVVGGGYPIRFTHLLHEMARVGCRLSFLRRTFKRELLDRDFFAEVQVIRALWQASRRRGSAAMASDHAAFIAEIKKLQETHDDRAHVQHAPAQHAASLAA